VTLKRKPYQSPELILLGGSAKDTADPHLKGALNIEYSSLTSGVWVHGGPQGQAAHTYAVPHTHTLS